MGGDSGTSGETGRIRAELRHRHDQLALLHDLSRTLAGVFESEALGREVVDRALELARCEGGFFIRLGQATPEIVHHRGASPDRLLDELRSQPDLVRRAAAAAGAAGHLPVPNGDGHEPPLLLVRAQYAGQVFGLLGLSGKGEGVFTADDTRLLQTLGTQLAAAMHTERLARDLQACHRIRGELEAARQLQRSLLPAASPPIRGVDIVASCQPAGHVGGDYFDFFSFGKGQFGIVIADVSGHGVESAMVMAGFRAMLHAESRPGFTAGRVLERVNTRLVRDLSESGMFISAFLAVYDSTTGELTYSNAGHPAPLVVGVGGRTGHTRRLEAGGPLLGLFGDTRYQQGRCRLKPGTALVLYTDGLTEARGPGGHMFREEELVKIVAEGPTAPSGELHAKILARVTSHLEGAPPHDDLTLIVTSRSE